MNMKKVILTSVISLLSLMSFGQNVNFPDVNFKAYLVGNLDINTNNDEEISVTEAEAFSDTIDISSNWDLPNRGVYKDLSGIEAFINLIGLKCRFQYLKKLEISKCTELVYLDCSYNDIDSLDINQNTNLIHFSCSGNNLNILNTKNNTRLTYLRCDTNKLKQLDVTHLHNLKFLGCAYNSLESIDLSYNINLTEFICERNNLMTLDVSNNLKLISLECYSNSPLTKICISPSHNTSTWGKPYDATWSTTCGPLAFQEIQTTEKTIILKAYNLQGQEVPKSTKGEVIILLYDNGVREKIFVAE